MPMSTETENKAAIYESDVEELCLELLAECGYEIVHGSKVGVDEPGVERASYADVILAGRLRDALARINDDLPLVAIEEAIRKVINTESASLVGNNQNFHRLLTEGVDVSFHDGERIRDDKVWLLDFARPEQNDWLAINQFRVVEGRLSRRPDIVLFVNGLPLGLFELKNAASESATVRKAFNQLQTYKRDLPRLLAYNELLVVSDGLEARAGTLTADWERFSPWRTTDGDELAPKGALELETLVRGMCDKRRLLDLVQHFTVFETDGADVWKKLAAYHQFHAVNKAVESTIEATAPGGNKRAGVVWHTQGSGKSLSMVFYAGKIIRHPALANPTLVVLTDRNDLDEQLFNTFSACAELLRQKPEQAGDRDHLKELLRVASGGVVFTTVQKFFPEERGAKYEELSDRRNIVVIADEAHRSQYDFIDGFARHMRDALPNASFIGFTGTPIESGDRSTPQVFGEYIDKYDIQQAVEDGATVPIYYEARLVKIMLDEEARQFLDQEFEEVTEGEEVARKEKLKSKWARLEALIGAEGRIKQVAEDIVQHFERREAAMQGKGMIVCMSRRICVDLYNAIIALRPDWHSDRLDEGAIKVVMTGSSDDPEIYQPHRRNKSESKALAKRFRNPIDPLKLVIVRDMWLTGFDVPPLHTMYVDKYMRGHGLMQAIARVNRVFGEKPGGLVVDYLGLADQLKRAMADYSASGHGRPTLPLSVAVRLLREKHEVLRNMLHGFDYSAWQTGTSKDRLLLVRETLEFILREQVEKRFTQEVTALSQAFALSVPDAVTDELRADVSFFQTVRAALTKQGGDDAGSRADAATDGAVRQLIAQAITPDGVIDLFSAAGLKRPDISILSDEFLEEVRELPQRNLALEALKRLLTDAIKSRGRKNLVEARAFSALLEKALLRYQNRSLEAAQVIAELIEMAKDLRAANQRGEQLGLSEDELAFYDALEVNDSAVKVLGDDTLKTIARELVEIVRHNTTIDWTLKESVRAKLRAIIKRLLRKHGYPPDKQEKATQTVMEQAELLANDWAVQ
jgi:type I restriction enzyme, R subunit